MGLFQPTHNSHPHEEAQHLEFLIVQQISLQVIPMDLNRKLITCLRGVLFCFVFRKFP